MIPQNNDWHDRLSKSFFVVFLFLFFSCNQNYDDKLSRKITNTIHREWVGKKLSFFDNMKSLRGQKILGLDERKKFTVVVYHNGDCGGCYLQLQKWLNIVDLFKDDVSFKFVFSGNSGELIKIRIEDDFIFPLENVLFDENDEFGNTYNFLV